MAWDPPFGAMPPPRPVTQLAHLAPPLAAPATDVIFVTPPRLPVALAFSLPVSVAVSLSFAVESADAAPRLA
ncbi:hypothetical protein AMAG_08625 [Allomyces macrogynus ATCC 38327]|uniref:Uncharacterized protein n=1 Tax=Allomyces macrogynus (strain ATCC 38327) TaxID=578462 RepID=A0A0L0SM31_ALLM3|nr:hypothetical protein AMAG_08625 [Allomyces macrogynus ATCC 38327]|eukprot:KNE63503.1 hypothetical protein AMAG_08625 [Allomyces macrogynus ATCC 38327]